MYYFNFMLFKKLNSILGMTQVELSMKLYGNGSKYRQKREVSSRVYMSDLVIACNAMRMSISHFITLSPDFFYYDSPNEYIIDKERFKPVVFHNNRISRMYGKHGFSGITNQRDFAKRIGVSFGSIYLWSNRETSGITVDKMLEMCNEFGVNLGEFVEDANIPLPLNNVVFTPERPAIDKYIEEIKELRSIISNDKKELSEMRAKNESLEFSIKGYMVAENTSEYQSGNAEIRKWVFNAKLLDHLPIILNSNKYEFLKSIGFSNPSMLSNDGDIPISTLINLCNKYQISSKHFFIKESDTEKVLHQLDYYKSKDFKQITFHPEYISDVFGKYSVTGLSLEESLQLVGYPNRSKIQYWKKTGGSSIRVTDIVEMCNALMVTPSCFITDNNKTIAGYSTTTAEFFLEENRMLRREINRLKKRRN